MPTLSPTSPVRALLAVAGWIAAMAVALPLLGTSANLTLGATAAITSLLALGVVILTGFAGQFSLASGAFFGIGAYGSAILTVHGGWSPLPALLAGAAVAGLVALAIGRPVLRLSGHFLAMGTLALNEIFVLLLVAVPDLTGGNDGLGGVPPLAIGRFEVTDPRDQFLLGWAVVGVALALVLRIRRSRIGRALTFVHEDEAGAGAVGIDTAAVKTAAFAVSSVVASVAGSLYAHFLSFVNPEPFNVLASVQILVVAVLGGIASPWGAVLGGVAYTLLQQGVAVVVPSIGGVAAVGAGSQLVMGVLLVVLLIARPEGLASLAALLARSRRGEDGASARALDPPTPIDRSRTPPGTVVLRGTGLGRRFGGVQALDACDIEVKAGEILAVIGPNGAGKSTLVHILGGAISPTAGRVELGGLDVTASQPHVRAARFGLGRTFQTPKLVTGASTGANAALGAHRLGKLGFLGAMIPSPIAAREEARIDAAAMKGLGVVGLAWDKDKLAGELSLGHRRLLEIGRAIAQEPSTILLDEPAAGLNRPEKDELVELLKLVRKAGYGVLIIEHDMDLIMAVADRIQVLEFGKTIFRGPPEAARSDDRVISAYLGARPKELAL